MVKTTKKDKNIVVDEIDGVDENSAPSIKVVDDTPFQIITITDYCMIDGLGRHKHSLLKVRQQQIAHLKENSDYKVLGKK